MKISIAIVSAVLVMHPVGMVLAGEPDKTVEGEVRQISIGLGIPGAVDFHGTIGVAAGAFPEYEGSDTMAVAALPLVDVRQSNFLFLKGATVNPNDGLASMGWNVLNLDVKKGAQQKMRLSVGPLLRYSGGRDEADSDALNGLGDIDGGVGLGGFIETAAGPWSADLTFSPQDAGNGLDGVLVAFAAGYTARVNDTFSVTTGVSTSWGDDDYMQGFYGLTSAQAARSGLARYQPDAGFKDMGIQMGFTYALSENWISKGQVGYQRLINDAGDSPIVDSGGSRDQFRVLFGVAYQF